MALCSRDTRKSFISHEEGEDWAVNGPFICGAHAWGGRQHESWSARGGRHPLCGTMTLLPPQHASSELPNNRPAITDHSHADEYPARPGFTQAATHEISGLVYTDPHTDLRASAPITTQQADTHHSVIISLHEGVDFACTHLAPGTAIRRSLYQCKHHKYFPFISHK